MATAVDAAAAMLSRTGEASAAEPELDEMERWVTKYKVSERLYAWQRDVRIPSGECFAARCLLCWHASAYRGGPGQKTEDANIHLQCVDGAISRKGSRRGRAQTPRREHLVSKVRLVLSFGRKGIWSGCGGTIGRRCRVLQSSIKMASYERG